LLSDAAANLAGSDRAGALRAIQNIVLLLLLLLLFAHQHKAAGVFGDHSVMEGDGISPLKSYHLWTSIGK